MLGQSNAALPPSVMTIGSSPQESEVEGPEHQNHANIGAQPFPESVSEEHEIYTDDDRCHYDDVNHDTCLSAHFNTSILACPSYAARSTGLSASGE